MFQNKIFGKETVRDFYDQESHTYIKQYQENYDKYPANLLRLILLVNRLKANHINTILDAGCGTCGPMINLLKNGFSVKGFDFSVDMIKHGKTELENSGYDPNLIRFADLEDETSLCNECFDAILALGVFPHLIDEKKALLNMRKMVKENGLVFIEFRNDLFAAFTMNKYSLDFFLNSVINMSSLPQNIQEEVTRFYADRFSINQSVKKDDDKIAYTDILAKFRNPLCINEELFLPCGFHIVNIHFYHYHALPPIFEHKYPQAFRELSLKMESPNNWKGYLMASAYVVEARKIGD